MNKKIFLISLILISIIGSIGAVVFNSDDEAKTYINNQYFNDTKDIDCVKPQVNLYPISNWECDLNGDCIRAYKYNITGVDIQALDFVIKQIHLKDYEVNTKTQETKEKDLKKQIEIDSKEYCKWYVEGLKKDYTFIK